MYGFLPAIPVSESVLSDEHLRNLVNESILEEALKASLLEILPDMSSDQKHTLAEMITNEQEQEQRIYRKHNLKTDVIWTQFEKGVDAVVREAKQQGKEHQNQQLRKQEQQEMNDVLQDLG